MMATDRCLYFYDEVEEMTATIPEVKYNFRFVDEKGALIAGPSLMTTNLSQSHESCRPDTGTLLVLILVILKRLTIPNGLTYVPKLNMCFFLGQEIFVYTFQSAINSTVTPIYFIKGSTTAIQWRQLY